MAPDIEHFGGKAANFGILRKAIPANCPVAAAFSFDLWSAYLDQPLTGGNTLREEIAARLSPYTTYPPPNIAALWSDLAAIRSLFTGSATTMSLSLRNAIVATLQDPRYGFDPNRNLRFRSSTNVEDSEQFAGAGLYDSFSGCLADDLDGDDLGPSHGDPTEPEERGVFRAIRKVFASFYSENAFLERLRFGVRESDVGMALLVHHSTPDPIELANGVATVDRKAAGNCEIRLVTQEGAVSVANPENGAIAEEVTVAVGSTGAISYVQRLQSSNLVPLGAAVMSWDGDYRALGQLLFAVSQQYAQVTGKQAVLLDLEYKKVAPAGNLLVKQVREIPRSAATATTTPYLIGAPTEYVTFQGENCDLFASHRLKSRLILETECIRLTSANLQTSFFRHGSMEYGTEGRIRTWEGTPSSWPDASYSYVSQIATDGWTLGVLEYPRRYELETQIPTLLAPVSDPLVLLSDLGTWGLFGRDLVLRVEYRRPVPLYDQSGGLVSSATAEQVRLSPTRPPQTDDVLQTRTFRDAATGTSITTTFYWPQPPSGGIIIWTAPLARWVQTRITGLASQPIVLRGYFSQTYQPGHHNFSEDFLFEPGLEPEISPGIMSQLRAKNIRMIHLHWDSNPYIRFYGFDPALSSAKHSWPLYE